MLIHSHRGAGDLMPENTLEAFELAWSLGVIPEADVRFTADGVIVGFHDENLERLAPGAPPDIRSKGISELDWETVSRLDVGSYMGPEFAGFRVPRITDILDRMRGRSERLACLDVKQVSLAEMASLVRERGVDAQVILASTHYEELREWMDLLPGSATLHWMGGTETALRERIAALRQHGFAAITQLQIHVNVLEKGHQELFSPSPGFMRALADELKSHGVLSQALVWGEHRADIITALMDLGVESFSTDHPREMLKHDRPVE